MDFCHPFLVLTTDEPFVRFVSVCSFYLLHAAVFPSHSIHHRGLVINNSEVMRVIGESEMSMNIIVDEEAGPYMLNDPELFEEANGISATHSWWSELNSYNASKNPENRLNNAVFPAQAWGDTRRIGCGAANCTTNGMNSVFVVCQYLPM
ncbi:unnamed protein product [Toxocara canis]|uniref:SCP domain-containing protein n=1 Tax=Toxocara canis TaxID=6265 RepID=A0A183U8V5_TOXCA|nr:unnamed protein product [Toxocara canis]